MKDLLSTKNCEYLTCQDSFENQCFHASLKRSNGNVIATRFFVVITDNGVESFILANAAHDDYEHEKQTLSCS